MIKITAEYYLSYWSLIFITGAFIIWVIGILATLGTLERRQRKNWQNVIKSFLLWPYLLMRYL